MIVSNPTKNLLKIWDHMSEPETEEQFKIACMHRSSMLSPEVQIETFVKSWSWPTSGAIPDHFLNRSSTTPLVKQFKPIFRSVVNYATSGAGIAPLVVQLTRWLGSQLWKSPKHQRKNHFEVTFGQSPW